jgi:hypothetical protein
MFKNLKVVEVAPVSGKYREEFALSYLSQRVGQSLAPWNGSLEIDLNVPCGSGDTRPLVRYLRMLSFYVHVLMLQSKQHSPSTSSIKVDVDYNTSNNITTVTTNSQSMQLTLGSFHNLYAMTPSIIDSRASNTIARLQSLHPTLRNPMELSQILDFYFAKTLAPAVILSHDKQLIHNLINLLGEADGVHVILDIDPTSYKMMKSLYDASDTPNLRDDILQIIHGDGRASAASSYSNSTLVAVELTCHSTDAQLCIREIIEDSPSLTAFSTERSALYKDGLLFGVCVDGEITPEIESRASLVI